MTWIPVPRGKRAAVAVAWEVCIKPWSETERGDWVWFFFFFFSSKDEVQSESEIQVLKKVIHALPLRPLNLHPSSPPDPPFSHRKPRPSYLVILALALSLALSLTLIAFIVLLALGLLPPLVEVTVAGVVVSVIFVSHRAGVCFRGPKESRTRRTSSRSCHACTRTCGTRLLSVGTRAWGSSRQRTRSRSCRI